MITVFSCDPGQYNFAWAVTQHKLDPLTRIQSSRVVANGIFADTITQLKDPEVLQTQAISLYQLFTHTFGEYGPFDVVAMERFMGRGTKAGTTSETTNIMMGIMAHLCYTVFGVPFPHLVNPASWKTAYDRQVTETAGGEANALKNIYTLCRTTPHQWDAVLIGTYVAAKEFGITPFTHMRDEYTRDRLMWWTEKSSLEPLVNRRRRRGYNNYEQ